MTRCHARDHVSESKKDTTDTLFLKSHLCVLQSPKTFNGLKAIFEKINDIVSKVAAIEARIGQCTPLNEILDKLAISFKTFELLLVLNLQAIEIDSRTTMAQLT